MYNMLITVEFQHQLVHLVVELVESFQHHQLLIVVCTMFQQSCMKLELTHHELFEDQLHDQHVLLKLLLLFQELLLLQ
jgi:hypothetical protein